MEDAEIVPVAYARHLAEETALAEVFGRDADGVWEAAEVAAAEVHDAQDGGCEDGGWEEGSRLGEGAPVEDVGVFVFVILIRWCGGGESSEYGGRVVRLIVGLLLWCVGRPWWPSHRGSCFGAGPRCEVK